MTSLRTFFKKIIPTKQDGQEPIPPMKSLAIFYGYPSLINGAQGNLGKAKEAFEKFDVVILGDKLQLETHDDHHNTCEIVAALAKSTEIFGYINIGVTNGLLEIETIHQYIDQWKKMKISGIFLDAAGFDYGVTRARQNDIINTVHQSGLPAFINAFDPDHVFAPKAVPLNNKGGGNPKGLKTALGKKDTFLYESFQIQDGQTVDPHFWMAKSKKIMAFTDEHRVQRMATTTTSKETPFDQKLFEYAWWSAVLWGFHGFAWGEKWFSADDNTLQHHKMPKVCAGSQFLGPVITQGALYSRKTNLGTIEVNPESKTGEFKKT